MPVSVNFLCAVTDYLSEANGNKMLEQEKFNAIVEHLGKVEQLWRGLEDEPETDK